jgi:hypothetical protein
MIKVVEGEVVAPLPEEDQVQMLVEVKSLGDQPLSVVRQEEDQVRRSLIHCLLFDLYPWQLISNCVKVTYTLFYLRPLKS